MHIQPKPGATSAPSLLSAVGSYLLNCFRFLEVRIVNDKVLASAPRGLDRAEYQHMSDEDAVTQSKGIRLAVSLQDDRAYAAIGLVGWLWIS